MISLFGGISLLVFLLSIGVLALHYYVMKRRTRLDLAIEALDEALEIAEETNAPDPAEARQEYEAALAQYNACVSRFPGNIVAKILSLP